MQTKLTWLVVISLAAGVGCTSNDGPSAMEACTQEQNALCALRMSCAAYSVAHLYTDLAACESRGVAACESALSASGTAQTPTGVEACAVAYPTETCTAFFDGDPVAACSPPAGSKATGAACGAAGQCASTFCAIPRYQICGTCQPLPTAGATCEVAADCGRNMACASAAGAATGTCVAYAAANAPCLTNAQPCEADLSCVGDDVANSTMGTCQPSGTSVGAACDGSRKTMASCAADLGLACIPAAKGSAVGTCQAITLAATGSACGDVGAMPITGFATCAAGGGCVKPSAGATGTCMAPAADGATCNNDPTIGPPCLTGAKCVVPSASTSTAGTCMTPNASSCM